MTNTYHNNDSGGTAFTNQPAPPVERVDRLGGGSGASESGVERLSPGSNPGVSIRETRLWNGGERDAAE